MSDIKNQIAIQKLARPHIRTLKPYASARDEYEGSVGVFLDANENALGSVAEGNFNRYPDPHQRALKAALAPIKGVRPEQIFLGNGSDEAIDLLFRVFCEPKVDHVLLLPPTYGMYQVSADINQVKTVHVPLNADFTLPVGDIIASIRPGTKLIFICSPNNPTGNSFSLSQISMILKRAPGLVVVDEAYIDFSDKSSATTLLEAHANLVVLQTFSKAWGMANLRLGMAFAHP
ncbi:MAG: aminotransferase class I/II-fold pyridoxal phosphate-dependent enzyme, partial [Bacteroidota bacterium]